MKEKVTAFFRMYCRCAHV